MSISKVYSSEFGDRGEVTLDGVRLVGVMSCNPVDGWVVRCVTYEGGKRRFNHVTGDIETERLTGIVTFTPETPDQGI